MLITWLGGAGVGLVWGWWMGRLIGWTHRPLVNGLTPGVGMILLSIQIYLLADWRSLILFLGAAGFALLIHLEWLRRLRARFGPLHREGGI